MCWFGRLGVVRLFSTMGEYMLVNGHFLDVNANAWDWMMNTSNDHFSTILLLLTGHGPLPLGSLCFISTLIIA